MVFADLFGMETKDIKKELREIGNIMEVYTGWTMDAIDANNPLRSGAILQNQVENFINLRQRIDKLRKDIN